MAEVIWLTRHGSRQDFVDPNWSKTAQRVHDPPLSDEGVVQARQLADRLSREAIGRLFSSPFLRCIQTAEAVAARLNLPIHVEYGFSEWLNPDWFSSEPEILTFDRLCAEFPAVDPHYVSRVRPVYPETGEGVLRRTAEAAIGIAETYEGELLFVGHGATIYGSLVGLLGHNFDELRNRLGPIHYCCLFKLIRQNDGWMIDLQADTSHLSAGKGGERFY
ncbi:MAG TPA: histidine phosphatase family protein [Acidobacteriota bacterium]|nr:histidine phosphatase family protein [Acidobacteriota bacterium]